MVKTCFVIMPIGDQIFRDKIVSADELRNKYDDLIKEAILKAKPDMEVTRADDVNVPGVITNDILKRLMNSDYVVADITYPNPNVFYELGLRHACRTGTILIKENNGQIPPFDISHARHIEYDNTVTGLKKLSIKLESQFEWFENNKKSPDNQFIELAMYTKNDVLKYYDGTLQKEENSKKVDTRKSTLEQESSYEQENGIPFIVQDALRYTKIESANSPLDSRDLPKISVVGCGGAGSNIVNRLHHIGIMDADIVAIDTDQKHIDKIRANKKILVGKTLTRGLGAGGYPETGKKAAELARDTLEDVFKNRDIVFITAGMGGGTGTGAAPVVADIAKEQGAVVIGIVTSPFRVERARTVKAEEGLEELRRAADTVIVLDNNRLLDYVPNLPIEQAFSVMDQLISETAKMITETITQPSLINFDYADIRSIMGSGDIALMLFGEAKGQDKISNVIRTTLNHPLLDVDYRSATGSLIHITGGPDMSLKEAEEIAQSLTYELSPDANVIWGARISNDYVDKIRVIAIMTGLRKSGLKPGFMGFNL